MIRDYEGYIVWKIANNSLAIFGEMCFLTAGPGIGFPMILAELPETKNCANFSRSITVTNKSNSLTFSVASFLVCTSPLAVTVAGLLDVLMVSNSAELRSLLLTTCIPAPEFHYKLSFLRVFCWRSREYPFLRGKVESSSVFSLSLFTFLARFHALLRAHRCCLSVSSWDWSSNFIA